MSAKPVTMAEILVWQSATRAVNCPDAYVAFDRLIATAEAAAEVTALKAQLAEAVERAEGVEAEYEGYREGVRDCAEDKRFAPPGYVDVVHLQVQLALLKGVGSHADRMEALKDAAEASLSESLDLLERVERMGEFSTSKEVEALLKKHGRKP